MAPAAGLDLGAADAPEAFLERLRVCLGELATDIERGAEWLEVRLAPAKLFGAAKAIRDSDLGFDLLSYVSGVDQPDAGEVEVLYHLFSTSHAESLMLRTRVPYASPVMPSLTPIWPAANWHERETSDMFLVRFEGHPYPKPLMLDEDEPRGTLLKRYPVRAPVDMKRRFAERFVDGKRMPFRHRPVRAEARVPFAEERSS